MPKAAYRAKLAELQALRQSGKKAFDNFQVDDATALYDEVDEDGYKKIVRQRLNEDDFVVDDNGEGYADDGREDWDRVRRYDSDSEDDELPTRGRPSKECTCQYGKILFGDLAIVLTRRQPRRASKHRKPRRMPTTEVSVNFSQRVLPRRNQSRR